MKYTLDIKPEVYDDIQDGINWYNSKQDGLGKHFYDTIMLEFDILERNPLFQIRYNGVRCLPMKKFPYMIHYIVNEREKQIVILAVFCTYDNPEKWHQRNDK